MAKRKIEITFADSFEELTSAELGDLLSVLKEMVKLEKAASAYVKTQIAKGKPVSGWMLGKGRRSREWKDEQAALKAMAAAGINDPYKPRQMYSVAEAEELPGISADRLEDGWKWVDGSLSLKPGVASGLANKSKPTYGF